MKTLEIYKQDLTPEAQARLEEFTNGDDNYDVFPIATLEVEEDDQSE